MANPGENILESLGKIGDKVNDLKESCGPIAADDIDRFLVRLEALSEEWRLVLHKLKHQGRHEVLSELSQLDEGRNLVVKFADGEVIKGDCAADGFAKSIEKMGVDRVAAKGICNGNNPLVARHRRDLRGDACVAIPGGWFINVASSINKKAFQLSNLSSALRVPLKVEQVLLRTPISCDDGPGKKGESGFRAFLLNEKAMKLTEADGVVLALRFISAKLQDSGTVDRDVYSVSTYPRLFDMRAALAGGLLPQANAAMYLNAYDLFLEFARKRQVKKGGRNRAGDAEKDRYVPGVPYMVSQVVNVMFPIVFKRGLIDAAEIEYLQTRESSAKFRTSGKPVLKMNRGDDNDRYTFYPNGTKMARYSPVEKVSLEFEGKKYYLTNRFDPNSLRLVMDWLESKGISKEEVVGILRNAGVKPLD